jgi:hypothetical protein
VSERKVHKFKEGCLWEGEPWQIVENERVSHWGGAQCKHCHSITEKTRTTIDGSTFTEAFWTCPRVVVAYNEGGNGSTGVCLDCLIEAVAAIEQEET